MLRSDDGGTTLLTRKIFPLLKLTDLLVPVLGRVKMITVVLWLIRPHRSDQIEQTAARQLKNGGSVVDTRG